ncbi:cbb3-type cytochrome c oxidase subunit 3 [Sandarakinorhabdus sp. DWP1-3-1]|uniref:cbb3-type cytochrome c oxidase subunit 3 n=1 Tax=Sandarakinorhabdus sp. DWP1-3-1 TaxID=2804627 RepID=UPI003CE9E415
MSYDQLRHLADSWGLVAMGVMFVTFVGWTFRKGSARRLDEAANMIFKDGCDDQAR